MRQSEKIYTFVKINITMKNIFRLLVLVFTLAVVGCTPSSEEGVEIYSLRVEPKNAVVEVGQTLQLTAITDPVYTDLIFDWSSADATVATVDDNGLVTAVGPGAVQILCKYANERYARATIQVVEPIGGGGDDDPSTPTDGYSLADLLNYKMIFSSRQLAYPGTVMQCFDFHDGSEDGYIYFTQCASDSSTGNKWLVALSRVKRGPYGTTTKSGETMSLRWFGHGTVLCVEKATDGGEDYVWVNSYGTLSSTEYTNNKTFCRFRFKANETYSHSAGEVFYLDKYKDATGKEWTVYDLQVNVDFEARRLLIGCRSSGTRHNVIYDLDAVLALTEKSVSISRTWGGESGTNTTKKTETITIQARVLDELTPLGSFRLPSYLETGKYDQTYSCSHQGHAIKGSHVYWYEGNAYKTNSSSTVYDDSMAFVEVFDYLGNRVKPRTRVAAIGDVENMKKLLNLHDNCYCEAEGLQVRNGKLYLGITTHIAGKSSGNRLSTILEYKLD